MEILLGILFLFVSLIFEFFPFILIVIFIRHLSKKNKQQETISNPITNEIMQQFQQNNNTYGLQMRCTKCNSLLDVNYKFCTSCGQPFDGNNVKVEMDANATIVNPQDTRVFASDYDSIFRLNENEMGEEFIKRELVKAGIDKDTKLIPMDVLKRKKVLNIIFSVLVFIYISLIFFHFPVYTYIIGFIILIVFFIITRKYSIVKYLKKQIKARPSEKISNIVMSTKSTLVENTNKNIFAASMCAAIIFPILIFFNPRVFYEKMDNGYGVRFYTFGVTNFTSATIPETYKNEKVVSLRGNTFSNMPFLKEVVLPDSITEIRGQAFKNDTNLVTVNMPSSLEYLGGGAFYNCTSLKTIELPDTLTYLGGESFFNAKSLESVKLSNSLTEIRGNTFEECSSLKSITIPDSVTRIGGHAFYGNTSLSEVILTEKSSLKEIGSSAFRECYHLSSITLPQGVNVNERAFKSSPTKISYFGIDNTDYNYKY